jgi:hypothetical protein
MASAKSRGSIPERMFGQLGPDAEILMSLRNVLFVEGTEPVSEASSLRWVWMNRATVVPPPELEEGRGGMAAHSDASCVDDNLVGDFDQGSLEIGDHGVRLPAGPG